MSNWEKPLVWIYGNVSLFCGVSSPSKPRVGEMTRGLKSDPALVLKVFNFSDVFETSILSTF